MKSHTIFVICPFCGEYVEVEADTEEFTCDHCGRTFVIFK